VDVVAFMKKQIYCGVGAFRTQWVRGWVDYRAHFYTVVKRQSLPLPELYFGDPASSYR